MFSHLSSGNFYGLAKERVEELVGSCKNLGVAEEDIFCLDDFEDNPNELWPGKLVAEAVKSYISKLDAKTIFTFDRQGVSCHLNHIAAFKGAR